MCPKPNMLQGEALPAPKPDMTLSCERPPAPHGLPASLMSACRSWKVHRSCESRRALPEVSDS